MAKDDAEVLIVEGLERLQYWLLTTRDDFDVARFREALPAVFRDSDGTSVLIESANEPFPYDAMFAWEILGDEVELTVDYHINPAGDVVDAREDDETESAEADDEGQDNLPCPEHLMSWIGNFFGSNSAPSHGHARHRYPSDRKQATFDMSLASELPSETELYGVALRLRNSPNGITSVRLTRGLSDWYVEIIYDRDIVFTEFSVLDDAASLLPTLEQFLTEKQR
ncbi:MAG: hypothetical protein ACXW4P_25710 [Thermoanaerobaculia bacterium]